MPVWGGRAGRGPHGFPQSLPPRTGSRRPAAARMEPATASSRGRFVLTHLNKLRCIINPKK